MNALVDVDECFCGEEIVMVKKEIEWLEECRPNNNIGLNRIILHVEFILVDGRVFE